jgi:hypothetical protein
MAKAKASLAHRSDAEPKAGGLTRDRVSVLVNPTPRTQPKYFTENVVKQTKISYKAAVLDENTRRLLFLACAQSGLAEDLALAAAAKLETQLKSIVEAETRRVGGPSKLEIRELFSERADKAEKASAFLRRVWGPRMKIAAVSRSDIEDVDQSLFYGLRNEFVGRSEELSGVIPTKPEILDRVLSHTFGRNLDRPDGRRAKRALAEIRHFLTD